LTINDPDRIPVLINSNYSSTAKFANLNLHDQIPSSSPAKDKIPIYQSINSRSNPKIILYDVRKDAVKLGVWIKDY